MKAGRVLVLAMAICAGLGLAGTAQAEQASAGAAPAGYYTFQKVVYQNDGGGPDAKAYFQRLLHHIGAHIAATNGQVEIRVVNFASGVQLFVMAREDADLAKAIDGLRAKGVRFMICHNTLAGMKLTPADLYGVKDEDVVPSGVAEIARLQGLGFVYIHP
ncbi:DsrE family protein [Novosphingobium nitrogenifigens]|uniref:DsrE family protein n=1 Tax=Novosphingobium nitrogenifigens TaxID=378548 RepID=UPI000375D4EC|nr:DsrE family protein [Novosphingobium nitrogenifigens]